jgi:hypothetical protein
MRKTVIYTFVLLFYYSSLAAQSKKKQEGWAATFTGALIPISQPGLGVQPGIEYRFNDRYCVLAEITIPANRKNSKDSSELNKKYFRFKSEMRYSFLSKSKKSHQYAGFQLSRASRRFINQNSFYFDNNSTDSGYYYSRASINSPVTTVSFQFGSVMSFSKKNFALDFFAGVGARFINTTISDIENPVRSIIRKPDSGPSFTASYSYAGNVTMLHLNGGIRLIWHFYEFPHPRK